MTTSEDLRSRVQTWVRDSLEKLSTDEMRHVHVDTLAGRTSLTPAEFVQTVTAAYQYALEALAEQVRSIKAVLVIPLQDRERLECVPPHIEILHDEMSDEPPSIYLVHREMDKRLRAGELYRCLLADFPLFERPPANVFVFFEVWRSERERLNGWEYVRTVFVEHYPPEHQDRTAR